MDVEASITRRLDGGNDAIEASLPQYGVEYVEVRELHGEVVIHFEGSATTPLLPTDVAGQCWWSNRGDSVSATLTRQLIVPSSSPGGSDPILSYRYWHHIEEEWDYLYVSASIDGGATWDVLQASGTTDSNPVGNSYGYGYTGHSDGWRDGTVSLAPYAGQDTLVRFHYVTDDAINGPGMCIQDMRISGEPQADERNGWVADGFVPVNNRVRQDWIVWVMVDGPEPSVTRASLTWNVENDRHIGSIPVRVSSDQRLIVAIAPIAPATMEEATYRLWAQPRQ